MFHKAGCEPIESTNLVSPSINPLTTGHRNEGEPLGRSETSEEGPATSENQDIEADIDEDEAQSESEWYEQNPPEPHPEPRRQRVRPLRRPVTPTTAQRAAHELTHLPHADWCRACVLARSQSDPHRRTRKHTENGTVPVVSFDFCFARHVEQ